MAQNQMEQMQQALDALQLMMQEFTTNQRETLERLEQVENRQQPPPHEENQEGPRGPIRGPRREIDGNLNGIKNNIPPFKGTSKPEDYLEWERKVDLIFECHNYSEEKKIKLITIEFTEYALIWWDQQLKGQRRYGVRPIESWEDLKVLMRRRFVPSYYLRDVYQRLQHLTQGSKSVEEYHKELEVSLIRANVEEEEELTMARFLNGLNREIANTVDLHNCADLMDMVHTAIKVEGQVKRKGNTYQKPKEWSSPKPTFGNASKPQQETSRPKFNRDDNTRGSSSSNSSSTRSRDIKCFRCLGVGHIASDCPNKRVMVLKPNGDYDSASEKEEESNEDEEDPENVSSEHGELFVVRRALNIHTTENDQQRENIFHIKCKVQDKTCMLIIDGGSCTNVVSSDMVERMGLTTAKHPQPYKLQWLNECGEMKVTKQVSIPFTIGVYEDEVMCDVVPMHASHILLGRPWQYDRKVTHDGFSNRYTFKHKGKTISLVPMSVKQVHEDQMAMDNARRKRDLEKKSEEKQKESSGNCEKKRVEKGKNNFFMRAREVNREITQKRAFLLVYKENFFNTNELTHGVCLRGRIIRPSRAPPWFLDLPPYFGGLDSRTNLFEEGGNDTDEAENKDPLVVREDPNTRTQGRRLKTLISSQTQDPQNTNKLIQVDGLPLLEFGGPKLLIKVMRLKPINFSPKKPTYFDQSQASDLQTSSICFSRFLHEVGRICSHLSSIVSNHESRNAECAAVNVSAITSSRNIVFMHGLRHWKADLNIFPSIFGAFPDSKYSESYTRFKWRPHA